MYANPYYTPYYENEDELEHFGVKGMKWGVRRYQNADGTLTDAGKKRYGTTENFNAAREKSAARKKAAIKAAKVGAAVISSVALASAGGVALDAALNSGAGLKAAKKGAEVLAWGLSHEGSKAISALEKMLNVQSTGWQTSEPSRRAQQLTDQIRYAARQAETLERMRSGGSQFIGSGKWTGTRR